MRWSRRTPQQQQVHTHTVSQSTSHHAATAISELTANCGALLIRRARKRRIRDVNEQPAGDTDDKAKLQGGGGHECAAVAPPTRDLRSQRLRTPTPPHLHTHPPWSISSGMGMVGHDRLKRNWCWAGAHESRVSVCLYMCALGWVQTRWEQGRRPRSSPTPRCTLLDILSSSRGNTH